MNREYIMRMAREAGIDYAFGSELERFAARVISRHVRETRPEVPDSMATWLQQIAYQHGGIGDLSRTEMEFGAMVAAAEREACLRLVEPNDEHRRDASWGYLGGYEGVALLDGVAAAIRARGDE